MNRYWLACVCAAGASLVLADPVCAQPPVPGGAYYSRPPAFSPYLNLLRQGASPALNYYGLVRPEMQFRQSIQGLSYDVNANRQAIGAIAENGLPELSSTGHPTQFMNLGGYFMNNGSLGGMSGSRSGGTINMNRPNMPGGAGGAANAPRRR